MSGPAAAEEADREGEEHAAAAAVDGAGAADATNAPAQCAPACRRVRRVAVARLILVCFVSRKVARAVAAQKKKTGARSEQRASARSLSLHFSLRRSHPRLSLSLHARGHALATMTGTTAQATTFDAGHADMVRERQRERVARRAHATAAFLFERAIDFHRPLSLTPPPPLPSPPLPLSRTQVHDCQLDYYGRRLATCSSDRTIKVRVGRGERGARCSLAGSPARPLSSQQKLITLHPRPLSLSSPICRSSTSSATPSPP